MASTLTSDHATNGLFDNIKKLKADGSNWDIWKTQVTLYSTFEDYYLMPKPLPVPTPTGDKAVAGPSLANLADIEKWDQGNLEAHIQIFMTLYYETTSLVIGEDLAAKVWATLKSCFEGKGLSALAMLASKLWQYNIQTKNDLSMQIQDMLHVCDSGCVTLRSPLQVSANPMLPCYCT